jgi:hypothetical protein
MSEPGISGILGRKFGLQMYGSPREAGIIHESQKPGDKAKPLVIAGEFSTDIRRVCPLFPCQSVG